MTGGRTVPIRGRSPTAMLSLAFLLAFVVPAWAQDPSTASPRRFSGAFVGTNLGSQMIFSGALINNIDVWAKDGRRVIEMSGGMRHQLLGGRLLVGAEVQYGFTNGDLVHHDVPSQSNVTYANGSQTGFGVTAGYVVGSKASVAVVAYAFSTERTFDISITDSVNRYEQMDREAFLRYGLSLETRLFGPWHVDASIGRQTLPSDDKIANVRLEPQLEFTLGVMFQF